jgi:hypothetical protein
MSAVLKLVALATGSFEEEEDDEEWSFVGWTFLLRFSLAAAAGELDTCPSSLNMMF